MQGNWVGIIEAAYRPAPDERSWVEGLIAAAAPALDDGLGVAAYLYEYAPGGQRPLMMRPVLESGVHPGARAAVEHVIARASPRLLDRSLRSVPFVTVSRLTRGLPHDRALIEASAASLGFRDLVGLSAGDPSGVGLVLAAPRRRVEPMPRGTAVTWGRVAAHLAAGLRLRRLGRPGGPEADLAGAEAIIDDQGRLQHAASCAQPRASREALRVAAASMRRAAGDLRESDPAQAVAMWRALVAGRWSLVDHFDRNGRRFLLARRNDPQAPALADLTLRERQVLGYACLGHSNKLIAYELGLAPSSIATHLARAQVKLGVDSRAALIRLAAALPGADSSPDATAGDT